jgi:hypothetical protein
VISIIPQQMTGGGAPIIPAITGGPSSYLGPPVKFKVAVDQFDAVTAATVVSGGGGYFNGEIITLAGTPSGSVPIGAPAQLRVLTTSGTSVLTVEVVNQVAGATIPASGSYFFGQTNPVAQGSSDGDGVGATFNLTYQSKSDQRVILTNQQSAVANYVRQVTDVNVFDTLFQTAFIDALAAQLAIALTGDKTLANLMFQHANNSIAEARKADGNEDLTVIDSTPDWIRSRGITWPTEIFGPYGSGYDWGPMWNTY